MDFAGDHHHHKDHEEHEDEEEEVSDEILMLSGTNPNNNNNHHHINNISSLNRVKMVEASFSQVQIHQPITPNPPPAPPPPPVSIRNSTAMTKPRYRECLRNHAINVMGHALDGCGEFMPGGPEGSVEALKCAACNCHRNFHRKEDPTQHNHHHTAVVYSHSKSHSHLHHSGRSSSTIPFGSYYRTTSTTKLPSSAYLHLGPPPQPRPLALPSASGDSGEEADDDVLSDPVVEAAAVHHHNGVGNMNMMMMRNNVGSNKKRFRTKFTVEQKEMMLGMAERIGWRIQKCDEDLVQQFCNETGVKRHVFKVWMHNNKHTLGKSITIATTTDPTSSSNLNNNNNNNNSSGSNNNSSMQHQQQLMN